MKTTNNPWHAEYRKKLEDDSDIQDCRVCGLKGSKRSMHPHHPGGRRGEAILIYFWVHDDCHRRIHDNPAEAEDRGWLLAGRNLTDLEISGRVAALKHHIENE